MLTLKATQTSLRMHPGRLLDWIDLNFVQKGFAVSTRSLCRDCQQAGRNVEILVARDLGLMEVMVEDAEVDEIEEMHWEERPAGQRSR